MKKMFTFDELSEPELNLYGKKPNGSIAQPLPLDPIRINEIQEIVFLNVPGGESVKKAIWRTCEVAINKELSNIKKKT